MSSTPTNKPLTWEHLDAPPVWGHGAKGDTIHKPEYDANGVMVSLVPASVARAAAQAESAVAAVAVAPAVSAAAASVAAAAAIGPVATVAANPAGGSFTEHDLGSSGIEIRVKPIALKAETVAAAAPETVFGGEVSSAPETVFDGSAGGSVYDETQFTAKRPDTSVARGAVTATIRKQALWFLITAALLGYEYFAYRGESAAISTTAGVTAVIYLLLAAFAYKMNRVAFLIAIVFYGFSTLMLLIYAMSTDFGILFVIKPLIGRCGLIYKHYRNYGLLTDLKLLEES